MRNKRKRIISKVKNRNMVLLSAVSIIVILAILIMIYNQRINVKDLSGEAYKTTVVPENLDGITGYCYDSDNGLNHDIKGTVYYSNGSANFTMTDFCRNFDSSTLVEYYCESMQWKSSDYICTQGCNNGVCI